jgi:hypothetical protein
MTLVKKLLLTGLLIMAVASQLQSAELAPGMRDVEVKMVLLDVNEVNNVRQSFTANLVVVMQWQDERLSHEGQGPISRPMADIWYPSIQILNQQRVVATFPKVVEISPDGTVIYRQRYWGSFFQPLELDLFPFDKQRLTVTLASVGLDMQSVRLVPAATSGISTHLSIPDWDVTGWNFVSSDLPMEDEGFQIQGMVFSLDVKRDTNYFKYKVILPLVLIVMMSWMVFWIDPSLVASQISVSVTAMLTMIAYRFALAGFIPKLPFLTTLDLFVLVSTLAVFMSMIEVLLTAHLATTNQLKKARMIDRNARWIMPLIYAVLATDTLYSKVLF